MSKIWLFFLLCLAVSGTAAAQLSISLQLNNPACSSNGSITVSATGGSGTYSYQLSGGCLANPVIQQNPVFNNLGPCSYTVQVTDGASGQTASQPALLTGNYVVPSLTMLCSGCSVGADVSGGAGPYTYAISSVGLNGPFQPNSPPGNSNFTNVDIGENYWVRVTDACGNVAVSTCTVEDEGVNSFDHAVDSNGNVQIINIQGSSGPYTFSLQISGNPTVNNSTGIFTPAQLGCDMTLTISTSCGSLTRPFNLRPTLEDICSNFSEGTASIGIIGEAVPPYSIICQTPVGNFSSTTGVFTGLPVNVAWYAFRVLDACGNGSVSYYKLRKSPVFDDIAVACDEPSLSIVTSLGTCQGGVDEEAWPYTVSCLSCSPLETGTIELPTDAIFFQNGQPGGWHIRMDDSCGDHVECQDSVILLLQPMCDSIRATVVDRFYCDNGEVSDRLILTNGANYVLKNTANVVLQTNTTGIFANLAPGTYKVSINISGCGPLQNTVAVGVLEEINPSIRVTLQNTILDGHCATSYRIQVAFSDGPYILTGGPDNIYAEITEEDLIGNCVFYSVINLVPGVYLLTSTSKCGSKTITLPEPDIELEAIPQGNCPGSGIINVSGAQSQAYWNTWGQTNGLIVQWAGGFQDNYSLDEVNNGRNFSQTGSPFTFVNVTPGLHTVYLYNFNSACPIDTAVVLVPDPAPLTFNTDVPILCDNAATTTVTFTMTGGKPPFTAERLDCNDFTQTQSTYTGTGNTIEVPGLGLGDYCFRVVDSCVVSQDYQFSIQHYQDTIGVAYNCDNTVRLYVDSISAIFNWTNAAGNSLGHGAQLILPNPAAATVYSLSLDIGECIITRSVSVSPTQIIPTVNITGNTALCSGGNVSLTAESDAGNSYAWSNGILMPVLQTSAPGTYTVTVTNAVGCTAAQAVNVIQVPAYTPNIMGVPAFCTGDSTSLFLLGNFSDVNWSNGVAANSVTIAAPGPLSVEVTDTYGCVWSAATTIVENLLPQPVIQGNAFTCENQPASLATQQPYSQYAWSNGSTAAIIQPGAGDYSVTVTDANGCQGNTSISVAAIPTVSIFLSGDTMLCADATVQMTLSLDNATGPVDVWFGGGLLTEPILDITSDTVLIFPASQTAHITVQSAYLQGYPCPFVVPDTVDVLLSEPTLLLSVESGGHGYGISCNGANDGQVSAYPQAGIGPFFYAWSNQASTQALTGLSPGDYAVTLTDLIGCTATGSVSLAEPVLLNAVFASEQPYCFGINDGLIEVLSADGGAGGIRVFLNDMFFGTPPVRDDELTPGDYHLVVEDANGCRIEDDFSFPQPQQLSLDLGPDLNLNLGDSVMLEPVVNFSPVDSFAWSTSQLLPVLDSVSMWMRPLESTGYRLRAWDEHGCTVDDAVRIIVNKQNLVYAPTAFSPNTDGINDYFTLYAGNSVQEIRQLWVFDRWGEMLFKREHFTPGDGSLGWDGSLRGKALAPGVFVWKAVIEMIDGRVEEVYGDVTLVR